MSKPYPLPDHVKEKVAAFEQADKLLRDTWEAFSAANAGPLQQLTTLLENRNSLARTVKDLLREESANSDPETYGKSISAGPFRVTKGESYWYVPELFEALVREAGIYDKAIEAGCIVKSTTIDKAKAEAFAEMNNFTERLLRCKDSKDTTPAVSGVKRIADFCEQVKD
jgi:hypothetical protein